MSAYDDYIEYQDELRGQANSNAGVTELEWKKLTDLYVAANGNHTNAEIDIVSGVFEGSSADNAEIERLVEEQLLALRDGKEVGSRDPAQDNVSFGADPVMMFSGQFVHEVGDIHISGAGIDFVFNRTYKNQTIFNGPLGYNWTHNFHIWLRISDQVIFRSTGDLREEPFIKHSKFGEGLTDDFNYWIPPDGKHSVIFAQNNSFVLRLPNGSRQIFEPDPGHSFLHRLNRIEDRFGNFLDLQYDADDRLAQVEINHPRRLVVFEHDAQGRICSIRDYTGREWGYAYDSLGDLIAVTSPATDRYDCGLTVCYDYSSAFHTEELQHNLIRIIDAAGQIYLETEYGTSRGLRNFNRVVRQRQGGGEYRFEYQDIDQVFDFDYPDEQRPAYQTILVERNGQPLRHVYNTFGNLLLREQRILENGLPRTLTEHYRYNRDGNVVATLSPEGIFTQHLFGRDYFIRQHGLNANGDVPTDLLTWKERQAFGRVRGTVRRFGYANFDSFTLTQGRWGDFPDILNGPFPTTIPDRSQDIIVKLTYEEDYGQLLTVSDPRYTDSPDPNILPVNEHPLHQATLTAYIYDGPVNDQNRFLVEINRPSPTLPDGTQGAPIVEQFRNADGTPGYNNRGRLLRSENPVGVVTEQTYFNDPDDLSLGHLRQTVVDPGGFDITARNEVDELGRVTAVHIPKSVGIADGRFVNRTVYNELDQVIETTSSAPFNFQKRRFYDRNGKLEREETDLRDENGQPELGGSMVATFCYDEEFNLVEATTGGLEIAAHLVTKYCYNSAGKRILTILPNGNQLRTRYDERQLPVAQVVGAGSDDAATTRIDYDGDGRVRRSIDARGNPTTFDFDAFGRVIADENALGHITRTNYDKAGNVTCVRIFEKRGNDYFLLSRSETAYDELNRAIRMGVNRFEDPIGPFPKLELDEARLSSPGPGNLLVTTTFYDAQGRIKKTTDSHPLTRETHFKYDELDRVILIIDPSGNETHRQYDAHNNLIRTDQRDRVLDESGIEIEARFFASSSTFDELDRLTSSTDSLGNVTRFFYDSRGNIVRQVDPLENELRNSFDIFNRSVTSTRFLTATGLGPVTSSAVPMTTSQEYDRNGNITAVIDALGRRTGYQYDALDRRLAVIYPDESQMLTDYDADGNVIRTQDNNGLQRFYTVDALSRTTRVDIDPSGIPTSLEVAGATFERYEYDGLDRQMVTENDFAICTQRFNSLSWPLAETTQFTVNEAPIKTPFVISRIFDDVGAVVGLSYPNGRRLQLDRDELNQLIKIQNLSNGNSYPGHSNSPAVRPITLMTYAGQQRNQCLSANGASTTYRYDGAGRLIEIAHASPNSPLLSIQYLYDAASNVRVRNDVLPSGPRTERFAYDSLYRLAHELSDTDETFNFSNFGPSVSQLANPLPDGQSAINTLIISTALPQVLPTYDYDLVGNREIERAVDGSSINYSNNSLDQYTSRDGTNFIHDTNGNLKDDEQRKYIYDFLNRLVTVEEADGQVVTQYWHDAAGRRILERVVGAGTVTQLIHDGNDIVSEYQNGSLFAQYVFDDGIDRPLHIAAQEKEHWYHVDLVGSVRILTDITGADIARYRYLPFGGLIELSGDNVFNPWFYTGRRFDAELETYDCRARQYDPKIGRFVQRDPKDMIEGTNLYLYVMCDPLKRSDPLGLEV